MAETVCIFRYETAAFTLVYPEALHELPLSNLRKLFKFMCSDRDINSVPIRVTHDALKDLISETHSVWGAASSEYQNGWTDPRYRPYYPSAYDCTGQAFTSWYKVFVRGGRFWAYHHVSVDV